MPESGKIYSFNEGNYGSWAPHLKEYMDSLKDADKWDGKPYSARCTSQPRSVLRPVQPELLAMVTLRREEQTMRQSRTGRAHKQREL